MRSAKAPLPAGPSQLHDLRGASPSHALPASASLTASYGYVCDNTRLPLGFFQKSTCQHKHAKSKIKQSNLKQA